MIIHAEIATAPTLRGVVGRPSAQRRLWLSVSTKRFSIVIISFIYIAHVRFFPSRSAEGEELDIFLPPTNARADVCAEARCLRSLSVSRIGGLSEASVSIRSSVLCRCEGRLIMIQADTRVSLARSSVQ